jgi:sugar phosphate isomerase/epimerase
MPTRTTRRDFLIGAGCLCGGASLALQLSHSSFAAEAHLRWPVTCRDAMLRSTGQKDCWSALRAIGAEGVEAEIIADTEPTGVAFAIENHGTTTNDPAFLATLFKKVGSQRLGLTLDTANFYWFGHPLSKVYELYEAFAPRVSHTHCKSIHYPAAEREKHRPVGWKYAQYACPIGEGDIDFARVAAILHKAGYKNDLCIEDESIFARKPSAGEATKQLADETRLLKAVVTKLPIE